MKASICDTGHKQRTWVGRGRVDFEAILLERLQPLSEQLDAVALHGWCLQIAGQHAAGSAGYCRQMWFGRIGMRGQACD
jgi:hypothetical protein